MASSKAHQKSGPFAPPALPGINALTTLSDFRRDRRPKSTLRPLPSSRTDLPRLPEPPCVRAVPTTPADRNGCTCRLLPRLTRPSPNSGRVGIRIVLFEACSGFTRVTARTLAQPPKAAFVTGLRRGRLPGHAARQLPAQSTTRWVEPSSTGVSRLRGAPEVADISKGFEPVLSLPQRHARRTLRSRKLTFVALGPAGGLRQFRSALFIGFHRDGQALENP